MVRTKATTLDELQGNVRTLTRLVADGSLPGLFVVGPGGLGKTHAVLEALFEAGIESPRVLNTHATARGLFEELFHARDDRVVLMEDLEQLFGSLPALSLLRSVLWGPKTPDGRMRRTATWATATAGDDGVPAAFEFTAGIIMTANRFPKSEIFLSLETRVPVVRFDVAPREVFRFMRAMVRDGQPVFDGAAGESVTLSREECEEVVHHLEFRGATDLRKLHHGLVLFVRHRAGEVWKSLLDTILSSSSQSNGNGTHEAPTPEFEEELAVVRELLSKKDLTATRRVELYRERTGGKSRASFFRRQRELRDSANG